MKKKILICIIAILIIFILSYCLKEVYLIKTTRIIDMSGTNDQWWVLLNISLHYDSHLLILPFRDDFDVPSTINIEIISNNKTIYTDKLEIINKKDNSLGEYRLDLNSRDYFNYKTKDLIVVIKYSNEASRVLLNKRSVLR